MDTRRSLLASAALVLVLGLVPATAGDLITPKQRMAAGSASVMLEPEVIEAIDIVAEGRPVSPAQTERVKALLFKHNPTINRARLNGWLTDKQYQAAQQEFANLNEAFGEAAATEAGAEFRKQTSKSKCFSPGTDSDYITKVSSPDQIRAMQNAYNARINAFLQQRGVLDAPRSDWHLELDTDFMADPNGVTAEQFEEIARQNNDAYRRRESAEYERVSRAHDGTKIEPQHVRGYAQEMQEFIAKKQAALDAYRANPGYLDDPNQRAEFFRKMAQEQKYIDRIDATVDALRKQNGLAKLEHAAPPRPGGPQRPTAASSGSVRLPENFSSAGAASAVSENSLNRALQQMAETYAEVAGKSPEFAATASRDIAAIASELPPAEKAMLLERLRQSRGDAFASEAALAMRENAPPRPPTNSAERLRQEAEIAIEKAGRAPRSRIDGILEVTREWDRRFQHAIGIDNNTAKLGLNRRQFNEAAQKWLPKMGGMMDAVFIGVEGLESGGMMRDYVRHVAAGLDSSVPDAVAQQHFEAAHAISEQLMVKGTRGASILALMHAFPALGAIIGTAMVSDYGGRWVLENTTTGQIIDRAAGEAIDAGFVAAENAADAARELAGGESRRMREEREAAMILAAYQRAFERRQIALGPGVTMQDLKAAIRAGDFDHIHKRLVTQQPPGEEEECAPPTVVASAGPLSKDGFNLSGDWELEWYWSITRVYFVGKFSGGANQWTFQGAVDRGGNAIWTAAKGSGQVQCGLSAQGGDYQRPAKLSCKASFADGSGWQGQAEGDLRAAIHGENNLKFEFEGTGKGVGGRGEAAGIERLKISPKT